MLQLGIEEKNLLYVTDDKIGLIEFRRTRIPFKRQTAIKWLSENVFVEDIDQRAIQTKLSEYSSQNLVEKTHEQISNDIGSIFSSTFEEQMSADQLFISDAYSGYVLSKGNQIYIEQTESKLSLGQTYYYKTLEDMDLKINSGVKQTEAQLLPEENVAFSPKDESELRHIDSSSASSTNSDTHQHGTSDKPTAREVLTGMRRGTGGLALRAGVSTLVVEEEVAQTVVEAGIALDATATDAAAATTTLEVSGSIGAAVGEGAMLNVGVGGATTIAAAETGATVAVATNPIGWVILGCCAITAVGITLYLHFSHKDEADSESHPGE